MHLRELIDHFYPTSPYAGFDTSDYKLDLQGWHSDNPIFASVIGRLKPTSIIEVGTWKGASAIGMAELALKHSPDICIACVDTFIGSSDSYWLHEPYLARLERRHGMPQVYWQFLANVILSGYQDVIAPLPMTSSCGASVLQHNGVQADLIYLDAGHLEPEVSADMTAYWPLVRPGGYLLGDDYMPAWPGVVTAVNRFASEQRLILRSREEKWLIQKPNN